MYVHLTMATQYQAVFQKEEKDISQFRPDVHNSDAEAVLPQQERRYSHN